MSYGVVNTCKMSGSKDPAFLVNVRYSPSAVDTVIENGNVVLLGALDTSERDVYVGAIPARDSDRSMVALVASPELMADERKHNLNEFINPVSVPVRGYMFVSGNEFSLTADCFTNNTSTTLAIGHILELVAGIKMSAVTSLTSGSTKIGTIIGIEGDYYVVRVS